MTTAIIPASASEALDMVRTGLRFLAAADATELSTEEQAEILRGLERANSVATAARTSVLGAFTAGKGYAADADYSPRAWLMHKTGIAKGAAVSCTAWVKRAARHPQLFAALQEAMRRLLAAGLLPRRAGQPVRALVHISLADLMRLDGSSALMDDWVAGVRAAWTARRAAASETGSDGGAWLDGDAARACPRISRPRSAAR